MKTITKSEILEKLKSISDRMDEKAYSENTASFDCYIEELTKIIEDLETEQREKEEWLEKVCLEYEEMLNNMSNEEYMEYMKERDLFLDSPDVGNEIIKDDYNEEN